ncbi:hypothetical protein GUJ93_ZPchr0012g18809 [Zizania palustris]|uniref:Myb/SANT-like domain-containing protein n=1 Tax=Zizania palustris TaxID=103762 RepID=A0A8J5WSU0_ZIZPA|nr:hypothetical protein GUJ93_ZPchr0012g18809 [Zizania palustris]
MDEALLTIFVEFYNKSDRAQNGWKPHVYTAAVKNVRDKCGVDITKDNIISRSKTFDKHYSIIIKMLVTSGFGWDWTRNRISVDSDAVWDDYINVKKNQDAACYRYKVVKFWDSISLVYCKDHATGEFARTPSENAKEMDAEDLSNKDPSSNTSISSDVGDDRRKRHRMNDHDIAFLRDKLYSFVATLKDDSSQDPKIVPPEEVFATLKAIPDLDGDDDAFLDAFDFLISDGPKFNALLALPMGLRKKWLLKHINK